MRRDYVTQKKPLKIAEDCQPLSHRAEFQTPVASVKTGSLMSSDDASLGEKMTNPSLCVCPHARSLCRLSTRERGTSTAPRKTRGHRDETNQGSLFGWELDILDHLYSIAVLRFPRAKHVYSLKSDVLKTHRCAQQLQRSHLFTIHLPNSLPYANACRRKTVTWTCVGFKNSSSTRRQSVKYLLGEKATLSNR